MPEESKETVRILKIGGASLRDAKSIRASAQVVKDGGYDMLAVSAIKNVTNILEKVAHLVSDDKTLEDAYHLFEKSFMRLHQDISRDLSVLSYMHLFLQDLKQEMEEMTDIDVLNHDPESQKEFSEHLLTFGERALVQIFKLFLERKKRCQVYYKDARNLILPDFQNPKKDGGFAPNVQVTLEHMKPFLSELQGAVGSKPLLITEGFITAKNKNLGRNGSDTTIALFAVAYKQIGYHPEVFYLKGGKFKTKDGTNQLSYEDFLEGQSGYKQPFVHPEAVNLLMEENIPFYILSSEDKEYRLEVGNTSETQSLKDSKKSSEVVVLA